LPRVYISSPPDALRTFNLASICLCKEVFQSVLASTRSKARRTSSLSRLHSLKGEEDFFSFSPALAQRRGGLLLFLACTRSKARRTSSLSRLHSLKGEEDFFSCLRTHESVEGFKHYWCLRLSKDDEVFKTFNYCRRSPKNDGDLKLYQKICNLGNFKLENSSLLGGLIKNPP